MPSLIARSPLAGQAPVTRGGVTLSEWQAGRITSLAPLKGQGAALDRALAARGLAFPTPGRMVESGAARLVWTGRDQAFLIGADPAGLEGAAQTDQSDGWACLRLDGAAAADVLMRLVPMDLREMAFPPGHAARAPLNHMAMVLMRLPDGFDLLVFRSMAVSAWHELETAMTALAARAALAG
ncbi:sarcosine oxidase subunit gamma [Paracoccaceae bacterium Fryx2]|nr:sarcosine oxidase subunit gamma [Paracoccaceae bacterium Fryx2]